MARPRLPHRTDPPPPQMRAMEMKIMMAMTAWQPPYRRYHLIHPGSNVPLTRRCICQPSQNTSLLHRNLGMPTQLRTRTTTRLLERGVMAVAAGRWRVTRTLWTSTRRSRDSANASLTKANSVSGTFIMSCLYGTLISCDPWFPTGMNTAALHCRLRVTKSSTCSSLCPLLPLFLLPNRTSWSHLLASVHLPQTPSLRARIATRHVYLSAS